MAQRPFPSAFPAPRTSFLVPSLPFSLGMHTLPCNNFHTFVSRPISPTCATKHDTRRLAIITGRKGSPTSLRVGHETRKRLAWPVYSIFPLCPYLDEPPRTFLSRHLTTKHIRYRRILRITTTSIRIYVCQDRFSSGTIRDYFILRPYTFILKDLYFYLSYSIMVIVPHLETDFFLLL